MMMIEISENKLEKLSGYAEKLRHFAEKAMECIEEISEGEGIGQREYDDYEYEDMGERGGSGGGSGRGGSMGQRRGVRGTGRYSRYR